MPFEKGKSGNPGGRPKLVGEVQALAREYTKQAIETLRDIMRDKKAPHAARGYAAKFNSGSRLWSALADNQFNRPRQAARPDD